MATQTRSKQDERIIEDTAQRIRDLNERILEASKRAGKAYVDAYEKTLESIAAFQDRVGAASQVEFLSAIAHAQADFTRSIADAYTSAARSTLK
jgi:hypothetical protein